jgi:hypothetical protein
MQRQRKRKSAKRYKDRKMMRSGALYLAADPYGRLKPGRSNSESQGYTERNQGNPPKAYWGFSMAKFVSFSLGNCTFEDAEKRLTVYEFLPLLGFRHFLINTYHEVCLRSMPL